MINEYTYFLASPNGSEPFGIGLYLLASRLDHSCVPTATVVFRGRELRVMAEKEVDGGNILQILRKKNNSCSKIIFPFHCKIFTSGGGECRGGKDQLRQHHAGHRDQAGPSLAALVLHVSVQPLLGSKV